jgi:hypothetical protein
VAPSIGRGETRSKVFWLGTSIPADVELHLRQRQLDPQAADERAILADIGVGVRAVLIPFAPNLRDTLARLFYPALDRGVMLAVVLLNTRTAAADRASASGIISTLKRKDTAAIGTGAKVATLDGWNASSVAERCASHSPGRDANSGITINSASAPGSSHALLLSRAFSEFARITLSPLEGGFGKKSLVWMVEAEFADGRRCEPFVVKAGDRRAITAELETTRDQVLDYVPFANRPPLILDRCVEGATERILVSMFVKAKRFDKWICDNASMTPVQELFAEALSGWRHQRRHERLQFGEEFRKYGYFPPKGTEVESLRPAFELAQAAGFNGARDPATLLKAIYDLPPIDTLVCHSHGDLHIRNVFVRRTGDPVMVDFASARYKSPVARDPATFEVSLAFHALDCLQPLSDRSLNELYEAPLLTYSASVADKRLDIIAEVRRLVRLDGAEERDYAAALACTLLYLARFPAEGLDQRGLAYGLADKLISSVAAP